MRRPFLALILALATAPYLVGLGSSSLWDSNEAFYAETPRRMLETGDYINPSFNDRPRFNKPPLSYWVVASFYSVFGVSEAAERLPIALGAIVLIGVTFLIGRLTCSAEAGLLSAIALALSPRFLMFSRRIIIDLYLAMFMGLTLLFFMLAERHPERRRLYLGLMYASAGLGFMTKGPVAILLPAMAFFLYLIITRRVGTLRDMMLPAGALIITAIVAPWYVAIYLEHGWSYIESFFLGDNLSRYTRPVWGPRRGLFFYIPVMMGDMFPWSFFLIAALLRREPGGKREAAEHAHRSRMRLLLIVWVAVIVVFFSFSRNKEDLYILPIYTAAAALAGGFLSTLVPGSEAGTGRLGRRVTFGMGVVMAFAGAAIIYIFQEGSTGYQIAGARAAGLLALAGGAATALLALLRRVFPALAAAGVSLLAINWLFVLWTLPDFERYKPVRRFSEIIKREAPPDAMVGYYRFASPSLVFYLGRPIFEYYTEDELKSAFASGREVYCIMTAQDYEAVREGLPGSTNILASNPVFQVKLRFILEGREPTQVILVHNKGGAGTPR